MKCPNCNAEIPVRQGKKAPYAYCGCGVRIYLPAEARLDNSPATDNNEDKEPAKTTAEILKPKDYLEELYD